MTDEELEETLVALEAVEQENLIRQVEQALEKLVVGDKVRVTDPGYYLHGMEGHVCGDDLGNYLLVAINAPGRVSFNASVNRRILRRIT